MKFKKHYINCDHGISALEVTQVEECITNINQYHSLQADYNKNFDTEFIQKGWERQPVLFGKMKGDFRKNDVVVEIQFGNSATVFRDLYKFHYAHKVGKMTLGVLILPIEPKRLFSTRMANATFNMADFDFAQRHFELLDLPTPILLFGLLPNAT